MDEGQLRFDQRLRGLNRKHHAMSRGYTMYMRPDGLIVAKPRRVRRRVAIKPLLFCAAGFFVFKSLLIAHLGTYTYSDRVDRLKEGTFVEQTGAWVMQIDPVSQRISELFGSQLR